MIILPINNTFLNSVTYIIYQKDIDYCILIDCGEWDTLRPILNIINKKVKGVLLTHGHLDHIYGLKGLLNYDASILVYTNEEGHKELRNSRKNLSFYHEIPFTIDDYNPVVLENNQNLEFEGLVSVEVIETPGHSPSCITYRIGNNLFTGDAYIPGVKVYSSLPNGNKKLALESIGMLSEMENLGYNIYCGHHSYEKKNIK